MTILSISLTSILLTQSFAEGNDLSQEQKRQIAIEEQMSIFSKNTNLEKMIPEGYDRVCLK